MARPYESGHDHAEACFERFPDWVQDDGIFQNLFDNLFDKTNNWDEAHEWHDSLDAYLRGEYDIDLDDYFDWEDWRQNYDES